MIIFAQKHLSGIDKIIFIPVIRLAIFLKVTLGMFTRAISNFWLPVLDAIIIFASLAITKKAWLDYIKPDTNYPTQLVTYLFTAYILIWLFSLGIGGAYDRPVKSKNIFRPMIIGVLITLAIYGLLPEQFRFSRGITLIGAGISTLVLYAVRLILEGRRSARAYSNKVLIVGNEQSAQSIKNVLTTSGVDKDIIGYMGEGKEALGKRENLEQIIGVHKIGELIFCMNDMTMTESFSIMKKWKSELSYKFFNLKSHSIIGSHTKNNPGELYAFDLHFNISKQSGRRDKRTFDIIAAIILVITSPILVLGPKRYLLSFITHVLLGKKTIVGYYPSSSIAHLPKIRESVITIHSHQNLNEINSTLVNQAYAKNYTWKQDLNTLLKYGKNTYA
jgi:hypothetical protein